MSKAPVSGPSLVWGVVVMFCAVIAAATVVTVLVDDHQAAAAYVTAVLAAFVSVCGVIVVLAQVNSVKRDVDFLANGGGDAKNRLAIADVVKPEHLRDDAIEQLQVDRETLDHRTP